LVLSDTTNAQAIRNAEKQERRSRNEQQFGNGEVAGDDVWASPVHGTTNDGQDVTVSFGQGNNQGQTLISRGHTSMSEFYEPQADGQKGHDHYSPGGNTGEKGDRSRW